MKIDLLSTQSILSAQSLGAPDPSGRHKISKLAWPDLVYSSLLFSGLLENAGTLYGFFGMMDLGANSLDFVRSYGPAAEGMPVTELLVDRDNQAIYSAFATLGAGWTRMVGAGESASISKYLYSVGGGFANN